MSIDVDVKENLNMKPGFNALDKSKFIRKVSNLERVFLWNPNCNVVMNTKIKGYISPEKLSQTLERIRHMHPLLSAKIVFDEKHDAWFSTDNVPLPDVKKVHRVSDTTWFEELQRELQKTFNLETGPMIRFILTYSEEMSDLVIICNHSICDGMALVYLVRDLLKNYINPKEENQVIHPPDIMDFIPKSGFSFSSIMTNVFLKYASWQWKKNPYYFTNEDYEVIQTEYWKKNLFGTVLLELNPHETENLSKMCKKKGVSIGSAITTAFIAAHEDIVGPFAKSQKQISVPFDLRRHGNDPIGDVFCLGVGAPRFSYTYNAKKPFWENVSVLHNEIHKRVKKLDSAGLEIPDCDPALMDALSCFAPFKRIISSAYSQTENLRQFSKDSKNIAFSIAKNAENMIPGTIPSNLGRLNIPQNYGDFKIEGMVFLPAVGDTVSLTLGGLGIGGGVMFSLNYPELKSDNGSKTREMIKIRNNALEYLGFPEKISENALTF